MQSKSKKCPAISSLCQPLSIQMLKAQTGELGHPYAFAKQTTPNPYSLPVQALNRQLELHHPTKTRIAEDCSYTLTTSHLTTPNSKNDEISL